MVPGEGREELTMGLAERRTAPVAKCKAGRNPGTAYLLQLRRSLWRGRCARMRRAQWFN
jgi:hypothetical protein